MVRGTSQEVIGGAQGGTTMVFPQWLTMQDEYKAERFYVRACYSAYYEMIKREFKSGYKGITITGTPGTKAMYPSRG